MACFLWAWAPPRASWRSAWADSELIGYALIGAFTAPLVTTVLITVQRLGPQSQATEAFGIYTAFRPRRVASLSSWRAESVHDLTASW